VLKKRKNRGLTTLDFYYTIKVAERQDVFESLFTEGKKV
jgi:hypothetical protein